MPPDQVVVFMKGLDELYSSISQILNTAFHNKVIGLGKAKRVIVSPENNECFLGVDVISSTNQTLN